MHPTRLLRATHVHKPMIQFIGKRKWDGAPHAPALHPAAPPEIAEHFQEFLSKLQSTSKSAASPSSNPKGQSLQSSANGEVKPGKSSQSNESSGPVDYERFYEAPSYLWKTKPLSEAEMEAVMSGGASNIS